MARWFIPKRSKRGDRGIVSRLLGGVGEVVFFAILCLVGVVLLAVLVTLRVTLPISEHPNFGVVGFCLGLTAAVALILVGAIRSISTVWQARSSIERRSAIAEMVKSKEARLSEPSKQFPAIPFDHDLSHSPGSRQRYRLPCVSSHSKSLFGATLICVSLLGIASVTTVLAIEAIEARRPDALMIVVGLASLIAAGWSIYFFMVQLLRYTTLGPTSLEISAHPLFPGMPLKLSVTQNGRARIRRLMVALVCFEEAIYQQGTNVRTERREVFRSRICENREISVNIGKPFTRTVEFEIPDFVMHSFRSASNSIEWAFVVRGVAVRWARLERSFPVIILPHNPHEPPPQRTDLDDDAVC